MTSEQRQIVDRIADHVRAAFEGEGSGHDWWHLWRVWNMAKQIGAPEGADLFVVELGALLHDIADWKFHDGDEKAGPKAARTLLEQHEVAPEVVDAVVDIVATISYKGAGVTTAMKTLEGKVVQDADRLDAIGALGIGRTFAYGGHKGRPMHDPRIKPVLHQSKETYMKNSSPTINHFYEKLLLLKDRMNTDTAKKIAAGRHEHMEKFLEQFLREWDARA